MKRALFFMILLCLAVPTLTGQKPAKVAPKHYKVAASEAPDGRDRSPDGRLIAYASWSTISPGPRWAVRTEDRLIELRIVGIDGSEPRVLYGNRDALLLRVHEWSPDGKYLAATVFQKDRTSQLVLVSVADASVRVLRTQMLKTLNPSGQWNKMSFSRDGRFVAYDLSPQGGWHPRDIFAIPVEGGPEIPLIQHPANDLLLGWTPDGRGVLFASDRSGHWDLWVIEVFDGQPRGSPALVKPNIGPIFDDNWFTALGFTRDGSYYYKVWARETELYVATLDPATNRLQGPTKLVSHVGSRTSPQWSRDGQYLAYVWANGDLDDPFVLGIRSAQTGKERRFRLGELRRQGNHGFDPQWSPDGRFILVNARKFDYLQGQSQYRIDVRTGAVTPIVLTDYTHGYNRTESPAWSRDSTVIFEQRPPSRIVKRNVETGEERELYRPTPPAEVYHWPTSNLSVSPDGQRVAFVWSDGNTVERTTALMVLPTAGGAPRELVRAKDPARIGVPAWTPDSRHIIYARSVAGDKGYAPGVLWTTVMFEFWRVACRRRRTGEPGAEDGSTGAVRTECSS